VADTNEGGWRRDRQIRIATFPSADNSLHTSVTYSGNKITPRLVYTTERGEGNMKRAVGSKTVKSLSEHQNKN
jgi:hypothetical protein